MRQARGRKELAHRLQSQAIDGQRNRGRDEGRASVTRTKGHRLGHDRLKRGRTDLNSALAPASRDELFNGFSSRWRLNCYFCPFCIGIGGLLFRLDSLHSMSKEINAAAGGSLLNVKVGLESQFSQDITSHQAKISTFLDKRAALMELQNVSEEGGTTSDKAHARRAIAARASIEKTLANLSRQRDGLEKLFRDWDKVQQKILCLAIETLGPSSASIPEIMTAADVMKNNSGTSFEPRLHDAIAAFELRCEEEQGKEDPSEKCMNEVQTVCEEAMAHANASVKVSCVLVFDIDIGR